MKKPFLFTPGPTPVPEHILSSLSKPLINHRSEDFKKIIGEVRQQLKSIFQTRNEVLILTCSGTGAMEGSISSCLKKDDRVLVVNAGKFGERFVKIAEAYSLATDVIQLPWGSAVSASDLEKYLSKNKYAALCIQASETSTGTAHPIELVSKLIQKFSPETLLIVDGITAVGAMDIPADSWNIDILISGSQKAFMLPPGLAFASLSDKAIEKMKTANLPRFYLDFSRELKAIQENQTAFTPSISLVIALKEALTMLLNEGLKSVFSRHERIAKATRDSLGALGLDMATSSPAVACTAVRLPDKIDGKKFLRSIREKYGFSIAGGQDQWEGKVIRLSHLGYYTPFELMNAITAIGLELKRQGVDVSVSKALDEFILSYDL